MWPLLTILRRTRAFSVKVFATNSLTKVFEERCGSISEIDSIKFQSVSSTPSSRPPTSYKSSGGPGPLCGYSVFERACTGPTTGSWMMMNHFLFSKQVLNWEYLLSIPTLQPPFMRLRFVRLLFAVDCGVLPGIEPGSPSRIYMNLST